MGENHNVDGLAGGRMEATGLEVEGTVIRKVDSLKGPVGVSLG